MSPTIPIATPVCTDGMFVLYMVIHIFFFWHVCGEFAVYVQWMQCTCAASFSFSFWLCHHAHSVYVRICVCGYEVVRICVCRYELDFCILYRICSLWNRIRSLWNICVAHFTDLDSRFRFSMWVQGFRAHTLAHAHARRGVCAG